MMMVGLLILRVVVGALFAGHGVQKLVGWLGGHGINGTAGFMESLRYRNGPAAALLACLTEAVIGLMTMLGFLAPLAAAGIVGVMLSAIATVHLRHGLWNTSGGIELPLVYAAAAAALGFAGPAMLSLVRLAGFRLAGTAYGANPLRLLGEAESGVLAVLPDLLGEPDRRITGPGVADQGWQPPAVDRLLPQLASLARARTRTTARWEVRISPRRWPDRAAGAVRATPVFGVLSSV